VTDRLPPELVARVDQRTAQCDQALDGLIGSYRDLVRQYGSAGAQGRLATIFKRQMDAKPLAAGSLRDILVAAVARLTEQMGDDG
jgi:hypothetical protein